MIIIVLTECILQLYENILTKIIVLKLIFFNVQWVPLNGITDNDIKRLIKPNLSRLVCPKLFFHT
jgi:hypothetical protein